MSSTAPPPSASLRELVECVEPAAHEEARRVWDALGDYERGVLRHLCYSSDSPRRLFDAEVLHNLRTAHLVLKDTHRPESTPYADYVVSVGDTTVAWADDGEAG